MSYDPSTIVRRLQERAGGQAAWGDVPLLLEAALRIKELERDIERVARVVNDYRGEEVTPAAGYECDHNTEGCAMCRYEGVCHVCGGTGVIPLSVEPEEAVELPRGDG